MPYIETDNWYGGTLQPLDGESYVTFKDRCVTALQALKPQMDLTTVEGMVESAWSDYILAHAAEATITIKREFNMNPYYLDGYWGDWRVKEVHSAKTASITLTSVEKGRVRNGDQFQIAKTVPEKQMVFGWANISKEADGSFPIDWDGDVTDPAELENAAYTFVLKYRETGEQHEGEAKGQMIESMMFTKEKQEALGIPEGLLPEGWWVGFHIPDSEVFAKVKKGDYKMFSVQGVAKRVPTGQ